MTIGPSWRRNSGRDQGRRVRNIATMPRAAKASFITGQIIGVNGGKTAL
jgi:hypothetical protein